MKDLVKTIGKKIKIIKMIKYKKRQNFSIDIKVSDKFKKICNDKSINMSNLIEKFMIQYIENNS